MDVYSHLLSERIVYLGTAIDSGVANALIAQLLHLEADNPDQEINLYINSEGGDPSAMLALYDTMRYIKAPVATTCVGQAVAAGAVLLAAGAAGRRAVLPHTRVVLHQPAAQGRGTIPDLILQADEVVRVRTQLEEILSTHTGRDVCRPAPRHRPGPRVRRGGRGRLRAGRPRPRPPRVTRGSHVRARRVPRSAPASPPLATRESPVRDRRLVSPTANSDVLGGRLAWRERGTRRG